MRRATFIPHPSPNLPQVHTALDALTRQNTEKGGASK